MSSVSASPGRPGEEQASGKTREAGAMRADARRNRAQILAAAEKVFAEEGVSVPVDEVASRARVGVGTLYRHFPTKEALFEAVIVNHMERLTDEARSRAEAEQPGPALFELLGLLAREGTSKRDLVEALSGAGINIKTAASQTKAELESAVSLLLARAQRSRDVRSDVTLADLFGLVMGACSAVGNEATERSEARMMAVVCDGLRLRQDS